MMTGAIELLMRLGITANYKGYWFLLTALEQVQLGQAAYIRVTKDLYPKIAKIHGTSTQNVERGIRTVIGVCWDYGNRDLLCQFCSCTQKPTNATFIASLVAALYLRNQQEEGAKEPAPV